MKSILSKIWYILSTGMYFMLAVFSSWVFLVSLIQNPIRMGRAAISLSSDGHYLGMLAGFAAYLCFMLFLFIPRIRHNLNWFMKLTHELTHALMALLFFGKIRELVVRDKECYVRYQCGPIGYIPITLAPYCLPIYTLAILPFRYAGMSGFMVLFDFLIAFTFAFHLHSFIKQTRFTQSDIEGCGRARSLAFISLVIFLILAILVAVPGSGIKNAIERVFVDYPSAVFDYFYDALHLLGKYFYRFLTYII